MMACHQLRPKGMRALPVKKVAILQLTSSPVRGQSTSTRRMLPPRVVAGHTKVMEGEPCPGASSGLDGTEILILNQQKVSQKDERLTNSQCPRGTNNTIRP